MTKVETIKLEYRGVVEFGTAWTVEEGIANVVIITGLEEYSLMYDELARFLNDHKFNVYVLDNFGQGKNVFEDYSNLGVVPSSYFRKQVVMTDQLVQKLRISARPMFILASSVGALFAQDYMQRYTHHVSKVCLLGCGYKNFFTPLYYQCAKILTTNKNRNKEAGLLGKMVFPHHKFKDHELENDETYPKEMMRFNWLTSDTEVWKQYRDDPLCGHVVNKGCCLELLKGMSRLYKKKFLSKIRKDLDVFLLAGNEDVVTHNGKDMIKLQKLYEKIGLTHVGSKIYPNSRHDVLRDKDKEEVYQDILTFLLKDLENKNVV